MAGLAIVVLSGCGLATSGSQGGIIRTVTVTGTPSVTASPSMTVDDQALLREVLSDVSTAKAQFEQFKADVDVACASGYTDSNCATALDQAGPVGTEIYSTLMRVKTAPAEVQDLRFRTFEVAFALSTLSDTWCAPGRDVADCYGHVVGTMDRLTQAFAGWDPYLGS